jgi:hypothetical protein
MNFKTYLRCHSWRRHDSRGSTNESSEFYSHSRILISVEYLGQNNMNMYVRTHNLTLTSWPWWRSMSGRFRTQTYLDNSKTYTHKKIVARSVYTRHFSTTKSPAMKSEGRFAWHLGTGHFIWKRGWVIEETTKTSFKSQDLRLFDAADETCLNVNYRVPSSDTT